MAWFFGLFGKKKKSNRRVTATDARNMQLKSILDAAAKMPKTKIAERFALEMRIGQGSMSKVWKARDGRSGRQVCLKILDKEKTKKFDARFPGLLRPHEGIISQSFKHKNCVTTYEWGMTSDGEIFLVMELIEGSGLNFLIETNAKSMKGKRCELLIQAAEGLGYVHDQGYMHRDICPRNMLVNTEGVLKLIDFGLTIPNTADFRKPGNRTGSANYMAPELIRRSTTDHRVDLFALGVTAYEMFTGDRPWEGAESLQTVLSHMNRPPRSPKELKADTPDIVCDFLIKAVKRDAPDRYQNTTEFRDAVRKISEQTGL